MESPTKSSPRTKTQSLDLVDGPTATRSVSRTIPEWQPGDPFRGLTPPFRRDSTIQRGAGARPLLPPPPCTACAGMLPSARWSLISRPALFLIHRRSFRAPTKALNHCVEVVRQQDRERFLCNTCALSGPVESILSPTHGGTYLADLLRTRRGRRCSPCTVRDHLQRPRPPTEAMATNTSVRLNPIKTTVSRA